MERGLLVVCQYPNFVEKNVTPSRNSSTAGAPMPVISLLIVGMTKMNL
jgi:hypothetical protein